MKIDIIVGIIILVIVVVLGVGAYIQIVEYHTLNEECVDVEHTDGYTVYNPLHGGSFVQIPETTTYLCSDGRTIIK